MGRFPGPSHQVFSGMIGLLLLALSSVAHPDGPLKPVCDPIRCIKGHVVAVHDGDTLTLLPAQSSQSTRIRVRLAEIDSPEREQPWGRRAAQALAEKISGRNVEAHVQGWDRYHRLLARLWLGDRDINRELVREGNAWAYRHYLTDSSLLQDEENARGDHLGLWSLPGPVAPWRWRHGSLASTAIASSTSDAPPPSSACGSKRFCREMNSCEQAYFYLNQCGATRLDGDSDGVPCEAMCR